MGRRNTVIGYILLILIIIGILYSSSWQNIAIPIVVLGVVFYLYKFPPSRTRGNQIKTSGRKPDKKQNPFRVIPGRKQDDDNEPPKFH